MTVKIYHLPTCNTCQRILKEWEVTDENATLVDIKSTPLTEQEIDYLASRIGSYEAIFSKRARKYKELGLSQQNLTEDDFKKYLLEDYTFLKRPVAIVNEQVFAGNSKKVVEAVKEALSNA